MPNFSGKKPGERFVARRGSRGGDWRWEPRQPDVSARPPFRDRVLSVLSSMAAVASGLWQRRPRRTDAPTADVPEESQTSPESRPNDRRPHITLPRVGRPAVTAPRIPRSLVFVAALALSIGLAVTMAVAIAAVGDDDGSGRVVGGVTRTPDQPGEVTREPTMSAISVTPQPSPTSSSPDGIALALWSDARGTWRNIDMSPANGDYGAGDTVPFMVTWPASPGETYDVEVTYDCEAIDSLTGFDAADSEALLEGPGRTRPDGAVPVPEILGAADNGDRTGLLLLYGGTFTTLPSPPPAGACDNQRSQALVVQATSETISFVAAAHLAADAGDLGIEVTIEGVGTARASIG